MYQMFLNILKVYNKKMIHICIDLNMQEPEVFIENEKVQTCSV